MCARLLRAACPPGHFVPVWVEESPVRTGGPNIRQEGSDVPGETKAERDRLLARNRKARTSNRLASETSNAWKSRMAKERSAQMRLAGTHEPAVAAWPQKRRDEGACEPQVATRPRKRRAEGTHEPEEAARPKNAAPKARAGLERRRDPRNAASKARASPTWRRCLKNAASAVRAMPRRGGATP